METYTSATVYDALNRPIEVTDPGGNVNEYFYDRGGALKSVELNSDVYVQDIHYDAKGQRLSIWYGNATKTRYEYDELTFMLRRLLTVNLNTNDILLDLHYWYDAVGNITQIQDDAQQTLYFNNSVVAPTQKFTYDALYRLTEAKGRELIGTASFGSEDNWNDSAWQTTHKGNGSAVQNYTQQYIYDEVGNILQLKHIAGTGSYTRDYTIDSGSNRMEETQVGMDTYSYIYDTRGNMSEMPHLDNMKWNISNELYKTENGTMEAYYQYSGGQRIRKWVDKGNIKEERIYLGNFEIYRIFDGSSSLTLERQTVHVSDDSGRIAMLETRTFGTDPSPATLERYIYSNHLQSASLELDASGDIISYEEYHPYGTTSYQAMNASINAVAKRYRYTGKERDEESGLYYHGARYYIPWLARWSAVDPSEVKNTPKSSYGYCSGNPISKLDPDGKDEIHFNYLTVVNYRKYPEHINSNVDVFRPEIWGVKFMDVQEYKWVSVIKNDLPNTYHLHQHTYTSYDDGRNPNLHTLSQQLIHQSGPTALYVSRDSETLFNLVYDFRHSLAQEYPATFSSSLYQSPSTRNQGEINKLLLDAEKYREVKKLEEMELGLLTFAVELVVSELLVLKFAKGSFWLTRTSPNGLVPERLVRVIPEQYAGSPTLGAPESIDVFVVSASELKGLNTSSEIAERLTLLDESGNLIKGPFRIIEFDAPAIGIGQPINRTNPGFIPGGKTAGGATEYVIPNYKVSDLENVIQTTIK